MQLATYALIAEQILGSYQFPEPLSLFLKNHFKKHKKYGSRDRKIIAQIIYNYLRCGKNNKMSFEASYQLLEDLPNPYLLENNKVVFNAAFFDNRANKLADLFTENVMPALSKNISGSDFYGKISIPAFTFLRCIRDAKRLEKIFTTAEINYALMDERIFVLPQKVSLTPLAIPDSLYAIQDASSQKVCDLIEIKNGDKVWDVCAASGGKSLALLSRNIPVHLFVSDIRKSILHNLETRFKMYNYKYQKLFQQDATAAYAGPEKFDIIICDVPCSGSGTWSRTPEQFYYFDAKMYQERLLIQKNILQQTWASLEIGGILYYLTCSAFADENEGQIESFIATNVDAQLLQEQIVNGVALNADFMYIASIKKVKHN